jgi:hypothetical protein
MTPGEFPGNLRRMSFRRSAFAALCAATTIAGTACGTIWGFEDPINPSDGGAADAAISTPVSPNIPGNVCVPTPPAGWQGPLILFEGEDASAPVPPPCLDGYKAAPAYDGNDKPIVVPAACACTCGAPENPACTKSITLFNDPNCAAACPPQPAPMSIADSPACTNIPTNPCKSARVSVTFTADKCTASSPTKTVTPTSWGKTGRACTPIATPQGGCAGGRISTPATAAPFDAETYCVMQTGAGTCPATYPARRAFYGGFTDTRACGDCTCGAPDGGVCLGEIVGADKPDCTGGPMLVDAGGGCIPAPKLNLRYDGGPPSGGGCTPEPHPIGDAVPTNATTICCTR